MDDLELDTSNQDAQRCQIAKRRWLEETAGTTWDGYPVHTDREAQIKLHAAHSRAKEGIPPRGWKFADGVFRELSAAQVIEMAETVFNYVDACFAREAQLLAELEAGTYADTMLGGGVAGVERPQSPVPMALERLGISRR